MTAAWLFLYVATLVHGLTLYGFDARHPASLVLLLPLLLAAPALVRLKARMPALFSPMILRIAGLLALALAMAFLRAQVHWDTDRWLPNLAITGLGLGSLWVAVGTEADEGRLAWAWVALWMLTGWLDPLLPFLGAGVGAAAAAFGWMPRPSAPGDLPGLRPAGPFLALFLLGLALPKPWWDWGLEPGWVPAVTFFAVGAALAQVLPRRDRVPTGLLHVGVGLLAVLYWPPFGSVWGLALGLLTGTAWARLPRPLPLPRLLAGLLTGLVLSFALHANAWLPGLRHLIWLGN